MDNIKLYGLERSGTNHLQKLMYDNFDVNLGINLLGFKHGYFKKELDMFGKTWYYSETSSKHIYNSYYHTPKYKQLREAYLNNELKYIFVYKNPYSWYNSIKKFKTCRFLYKHVKEGDIKWCIEHWNNTLKSYLDVKKLNSDYFIYDYEEYVGNEIKLLDDISSNLNISKNITTQLVLNTMRKNCNEENHTSDQLFNHNYYLNQEYLKELTEREMEVIGENVNPFIAKEYNIDIL